MFSMFSLGTFDIILLLLSLSPFVSGGMKNLQEVERVEIQWKDEKSMGKGDSRNI